jgi:predicted Zn finger-like uncharacterized protein
MAVEALCPLCGAVFSLRDDMQGKKVRCTKCEQVFTVGGGAKAKPAAEKQSVQSRPAAPAKKSARDDDDDDEVSTSKKNRAAAKRGRDDDDDDDDRPKKGAARRGKDDDDDDDDGGKKAKAKKKRTYHDDDDEDDAPRKPAKKKSGGGAGVVLGIIGGVVLLVLLACGGIGYWFYRTANEVVDNANDQLQQAAANANNGNPPANFPNGNPPPNFPNFPNIPGPGGNPMQPDKKHLATVDDALRDLKSDNENERRAALEWLAKANFDKGRQAEVSLAINPLLKNPDNWTRERAVNVLKVWGTKDNLDGLIQILNEATPGPPQPGLVIGAIDVLGKLQDERGAEPVWRFRESIFSWEAADKSLKAMGQAAGEKAALARIDDPNGNIQNAARGLLVFYGTKDTLKLKQVADDLKGDDRNRRNVAFDYLAKNPVVASERATIALAMNAGLETSEVSDGAMTAIEKWATADNVPPLIKAIDDDRFPHKKRAMLVLGKLKDVRAAEPLAAKLTTGDRRDAADALIALGPIGKPAVEKYATNPDKGVQKEVDRVLSSYGADTSGLGITRLLTELESPDGGRRAGAVRQLTTMKVDPKEQAKVYKALEKVAEDDMDRGIQELAVKAMGAWGTKADAAPLIKIIENKEKYAANVRHPAMDVLAKWKAEDAIKPIALNIGPDGGDRAAATKALIAMGPDLGDKIEVIVLEGLSSTDKNVVVDCVKVLSAVGTSKSVKPLTNLAALVAKKDRNLATQCVAAAQAIQLRGK